MNAKRNRQNGIEAQKTHRTENKVKQTRIALFLDSVLVETTENSYMNIRHGAFYEEREAKRIIPWQEGRKMTSKWADQRL